MNRVLISVLMLNVVLLGWPNEVKVNDNITGKLSLFPKIVRNDQSFGPQVWVIWEDNRNSGSYDIYVNGLTSTGTRGWNQDVVISRNYPGINTYHGHRLSSVACTDDSGGAYIGYINHHNLFEPPNYHYAPGIYVRRLKPDGTMWAKPCSISTSTTMPSLVSDGAGGVICAWMEYNALTKRYRVMATRINTNGIKIWTPTNVPVRGTDTDADTFEVRRVKMVSDGEGGAWIGWITGSGTSQYDTLYVRNVHNDGSMEDPIEVYKLHWWKDHIIDYSISTPGPGEDNSHPIITFLCYYYNVINEHTNFYRIDAESLFVKGTKRGPGLEF